MITAQDYETKLKRRKAALLNSKRKFESLLTATENALERCNAEITDIDRMLSAYEERKQ